MNLADTPLVPSQYDHVYRGLRHLQRLGTDLAIKIELLGLSSKKIQKLAHQRAERIGIRITTRTVGDGVFIARKIAKGFSEPNHRITPRDEMPTRRGFNA